MRAVLSLLLVISFVTAIPEPCEALQSKQYELLSKNPRTWSSSLFPNKASFTSTATPTSGILDWTLRGGADVAEGSKDEEKENTPPPPAITSTKPVKLLFQTSWGNAVVDHQIELMATRTRNIFTLKKSLSRQLPGKPPMRALELVYQGKILDDEMLVDELFDDDDDEDEEELEEDEDGNTKTIFIHMVPPVDPKFATKLTPLLKGSSAAADDKLTTEELLQAYFLNQVAMTQNAMLLGNPDHAMSSTFRLEMREQAQQLMDQFREQTPPDVWSASLETKDTKGVTEERRGHRYRTSAGGIHSSVRKTIQTNLNIQWGETLRTFCLFLFFGYFGGRDPMSRLLLLIGAPMCFILQARPVKLWTKTLFYMMTNPPPVISSLLPAPQQAILNVDLDEAYETLYGKKVTESGDQEVVMNDEEGDEDDSDVEDED